MSTASNMIWPESDGAGPLLRAALERLDSADPVLEVDLSRVERLDAAALRAIGELAAKARDRSVQVVLRGVNVRVYKVLKLVAVAGQFSFQN
jgi:anti-anti-sigma regulatory factor